MADPQGFLKYGRELPTRRPVAERIKDWIEVYEEFPEDKLKAQAARCMDCGIPFCHKGCPLGNIIPDWNDLVYRGRWQDALAELHATNNFPEFTGKLCPAPCETACVLGINQDPVTIKRIEETIALRGWAEGWIQPEPPVRSTGKTVAVIGSGPAGLAAAQQLCRAGHIVTVFESADQIGGLLRYGIPDFKMEKWVLDRRLKQMEAEGVTFQTNIHVGTDISGEALQAQFNAIVIAIGSTVPRDLPVDGRELDGIHFAMDYLPQQNKQVAGTWQPDTPQITAKNKNVVILGGGDTGADCLGTAIRQGAKQINQYEILPRPPDARDGTMPWPGYPMIFRVSSAHEENDCRDYAINTKRLSGANGKVTHLHAVRVEWCESPNGGRPTMQEVSGSEFTVEADLVLLAMGFVHPQKEGLLSQLGVQLDARGNIQADETYATSVPNVWACGDARRGQSLIVWAIAEGREAARSVDAALMGTTPLPLTGAKR